MTTSIFAHQRTDAFYTGLVLAERSAHETYVRMSTTYGHDHTFTREALRKWHAAQDVIADLPQFGGAA